MELHQPLASRVAAWREGDLPHKTFPAIAELFAGPLDGDGQEAPSRSLRAAQLRALET